MLVVWCEAKLQAKCPSRNEFEKDHSKNLSTNGFINIYGRDDSSLNSTVETKFGKVKLDHFTATS